MTKWCILMLAAFSLCGCATIQRNMRQNLADRCTQSGYGVTHPQHEECIVNTAEIDRQQGQQDAQAAFLFGMAAGAYSNANPAPAQPRPVGQEYWLTLQWYADRRLHCQYSDNSIQVLPVGPCPQTVVR